MQPIRETLSIYERRTVSFSEEHREMETYPEVPVGLGAFLVEQSFFPENERNDQELSKILERLIKEQNGTEREFLEKNC